MYESHTFTTYADYIGISQQQAKRRYYYVVALCEQPMGYRTQPYRKTKMCDGHMIHIFISRRQFTT